ncbi:MAG TPA: VWA domain-containing protein [Planctomycetaceae bacterium]|nr:VWA domain-containing protein [Planctomycetaceae bacterium]
MSGFGLVSRFGASYFGFSAGRLSYNWAGPFGRRRSKAVTFVNPLLLAGTALIVVPIVLHLVMRQRPRYFEFPALRFVERRHEVNRRRLRLRHWLLLVLRAAAIALLALAMARPSVKFGGAVGSRDAPVAAALVFDSSMRMDYRHRNQSRLEVARQWGLWLVGQLPEGSQVAVLDSRPGPGAFQVDRGAARHRIEMLQTAAVVRPLPSAMEEALRVLESSQLARKEVYVLTDMAEVAWPEGTGQRLAARAGRFSDLGIYVIDVGVPEPVNSGLGPLRLSGQTLANRSPLRIETDVYHVGPPVERTVELHMLDPEGGWQKRSEKLVSLQPGRTQAVEFLTRALSVGTYQGYVQLMGQDGLACDNRRYFTVEVKRPWRVLIAAPGAPERHGRILAEMLAPSGLARSGRARFDCQLSSLGRLDSEPLEQYAAVCLVDPRALEPAVWQKLTNYTADGHGLGIFLGPGATHAEPFNHPKAQELLPAPLLNKLMAPEGSMYLRPERLDHPILSVFRGLGPDIPWEVLAVFRYWQLGSLAKGVHVVANYSNGSPAILERVVGGGRSVTVTTPVSVQSSQDPWNLWPYDDSGLAVMLVNGIVLHLVGSTDVKLNYYAGETAILPLDPGATYRSYALSILDSPEAMEMRLTPDLKQRALVVAATENVGNYRIRAGGTASGVDRGFSVNMDPRQTSLERIAPEQLEQVLGGLPVQLTQDREDLDQQMSRGRVGHELFALLILLVALILGAEHVVANRFYRE